MPSFASRDVSLIHFIIPSVMTRPNSYLLVSSWHRTVSLVLVLILSIRLIIFLTIVIILPGCTVKTPMWNYHPKLISLNQGGEIKKMDGKELFKEVCHEQGIDCNKIFKIGAQRGTRDRVIFRWHNHQPSNPQRFAVNYDPSLCLYVAWDTNSGRATKTQRIFSINKSVISDYRSGLEFRGKNLEYSGWDCETIYVFDAEAIPIFIKKAVEKANASI